MVLNNHMKAAIRRQVMRWLKDRCEILAETHTFDETGAPVVSWSSVQADIPCRMILNKRGGYAPALVGEQDSIQETYRLALPADVALTTDQRIQLNGVVYAVVGFEDGMTDQMTNIAYVSRRDGANMP